MPKSLFMHAKTPLLQNCQLLVTIFLSSGKWSEQSKARMTLYIKNTPMKHGKSDAKYGKGRSKQSKSQN
jgi:hypothetical protein